MRTYPMSKQEMIACIRQRANALMEKSNQWAGKAIYIKRNSNYITKDDQARIDEANAMSDQCMIGAVTLRQWADELETT